MVHTEDMLTVAFLGPDAAPGAIPAHVTVAYSVWLRDRLGRRWLCRYDPAVKRARVCVLPERPH